MSSKQQPTLEWLPVFGKYVQIATVKSITVLKLWIENESN